MWICLNGAFLSIVNPEAKPGPLLLVRARRKGDIESVFPNAVVEKRPERDYLFRTLLPREEVGAAIASQVEAIDYPNFKASVSNNRLHSAYNRIWSIMAALQPTPPYSGTKTSRQRSFLP